MFDSIPEVRPREHHPRRRPPTPIGSPRAGHGSMARGGSGHGDTMDTRIVWFRRDLRLHDLPALHAALADATDDTRVVPLFVWDPAIVERGRVSSAPMFNPPGASPCSPPGPTRITVSSKSLRRRLATVRRVQPSSLAISTWGILS